jgi:hypothetical protein
MNPLTPVVARRAPELVAASGEKTVYRFIEFFPA